MAKSSKDIIINPQEVWWARFPFEEDPTKFTTRPVIVLQEISVEDMLSVLEIETDESNYLSVKVTKHKVRSNDPYDTEIVKWREANLNEKSTARIAKTINLPKSQFIDKIGIADDEDYERILTKYGTYLSDN
jgi:mRNA-degrading endonuclease toxin of MazEF toxin-antitoxin module